MKRKTLSATLCLMLILVTLSSSYAMHQNQNPSYDANTLKALQEYKAIIGALHQVMYDTATKEKDVTFTVRRGKGTTLWLNRKDYAEKFIVTESNPVIKNIPEFDDSLI